MKKMHIKQLIWSHRKVRNSILRKQLMLFFAVILLQSVSFTGFALSHPDQVNNDDIENVIGGLGTATVMGVVGNVNSVSNKQRTGRQVKSRLWIVSKDQVDDTVPFPTLNGDRTRGNIPLKAGEYWHYIDTVIDSPEPKWRGEEGDVATTLIQELPFIVGGMTDEVFNLLEQGAGKEFIIVWEVCSTGEIFGGGNGCKGLKLSTFEGGSTKDNTSTTITFTGQCGELWYRYTGNTPTQAPAVVAADATEITLTSNPQYQLSDGGAAAAAITGFTGVTDSDINRVVTILGSGGSYPSTIAAANSFLLVGGETWTATEGARIDFKIFKDGPSSYTFVEVAGTRVE